MTTASHESLHEVLPVISNSNCAESLCPKGNLMSPILVVASTESRFRLAGILRQAGYAVAEADSGQSALKTAHSVSPELILMAIVMPDSNGLEVAAKLRRHLSSELPPIILLGSITPIGLDEEPLVSLVNGYLDIGASSDDLLATVRSHITTDVNQMH
jgi:CheY-like chemotaxis protein